MIPVATATAEVDGVQQLTQRTFQKLKPWLQLQLPGQKDLNWEKKLQSNMGAIFLPCSSVMDGI